MAIRTVRHLTVMMKVTDVCPLTCAYCYQYPAAGRQMDSQTLENATTVTLARPEPELTTYLWHGGEPLAAGLEFFRAARGHQRHATNGHTIRNSLQTNGVLLTEGLADFLVTQDFGVGVSLDGPPIVHDRTRPFADGRGSFRQTMHAIDLMRSRGKPPGVIAVLTRHSLPYLDEIYSFFKAEGLNFLFNPLVHSGRAATQRFALGLSVEEESAAMCHLFDRWFDDHSGTFIRFENMMSLATAMFCGRGKACNMLRNCQESFLAIDFHGTVLPCTEFTGTDMSYGNINTAPDLDGILSHPRRLQMLRRYSLLEECQECEYNSLCHGGCLHKAYTAGSALKRDPRECALNRTVFRHVAGRLRGQLAVESVSNHEGGSEDEDGK
ncbi:radical SAM protein [Verrucomicrobiota bacterium]